MKKLTLEQETQILKNILEDGEYLAIAGTARIIIFDYDKFLELGLDSNQYVIKIALGTAGLSQNEHEVLTYLSFGSILPLAKIVAAGETLIIMEKVYICNAIFDVYDDYTSGNFYRSTIFTKEAQAVAYKAWNTIYDFLGDLPTDFCQLGFRYTEEDNDSSINIYQILDPNHIENKSKDIQDNPDLVAYDYGYDVDLPLEVQISPLREIEWDNREFNLYLQSLIELLKDTEDFYTKMEQLEYDFLVTYEKYYNEEMWEEMLNE